MAYTIQADYKKLIQVDNLSQVLGGDFNQLISTELRATQELSSYLVQKYDMALELTATSAWTYGTTRKAKARFYLDAEAYSVTSTYALNSLVLQEGKVYFCISPIVIAEPFNVAKWDLLGPQYYLFYVVTPNPDWNYYEEYTVGSVVFFKDKNYTALANNTGLQPDATASAWGAGTAYSVAGSVLPTDTTKYIPGDNRNQQILGAIIDIVLYHLHARIAPHNIPAIRYDRYKDVLEWLKNCARGDDYTLAVTKIQPNVGMRNVYGSSQTKSNNFI
jgi:hypothetical protein